MGTYYFVMFLVVVLAQLAQPAQRKPVHAWKAEPQELDVTVPRRRLGNHVFAVLSAAVLIGYAGLRWGVGVDYRQYEANYAEYVNAPRSELGPFDEPGIRWIAKLAAQINDDPATMFFIASLITVGLTVYTIYRNAANLPLALLLYVLVESWQGSFNGVRQYLACAVVFAGHKFILERRFRPYLLVVLAATLFHISALIMLIAYWIPRRQLRPLASAGLMVVALLTLNFYGYIGDVVSAIKDDDVAAGSYFAEQINPLRILMAFVPSMVYLLFTVKKDLSAEGHFYANMMLINGAILLAAANSAYLARFGIYSGVFITLAVPALINSRDRSLRVFLILAVICLYAVFWHYDTSPVSALNPYRSVFDR